MKDRLKPPGYERIVQRGYVKVKMAEANRWRYKHHLIWEAVNGPIPEGHAIKFVDGDKNNLRLDNLALVSKNELLTSCSRESSRKRQRPIGEERVDQGYVVVKVAQPDVWKKKSLLIWEAAHGPVPEGYYVKFADGDKSNFRLDNLILVSWAEHGRMLNRQYIRCPIGTEYVSPQGFAFIKVSDRSKVWRLKHRLIWEAIHGEIPEGHAVWFADGDKSNFRLENLILISLRENGYLLRKGMADLKGDLLKTAVNVAKLGLAINDKRREKEKL